MQVRFLSKGTGRGRGVQIEGVTYFPGQVASLPEYWAFALVRAGECELYHEQAVERVAVAEVEHRDTFPKKKRKS